MRMTTIGRRSGQERSVILGYLEDGPNLVTLAMNGWGAAEPAWWLNLQEHPQARVQLADGERDVVARAATSQERQRLWELFRTVDENLDGYAARRPTETAVVVLEPSATASS
jgi:deazaflavin-dependent oxidoreductase (nitroreductase family)